MRFTQLLPLAASASAFLLPDIYSTHIDTITTLPIENAIAIDQRIVELDCPGCPVRSLEADTVAGWHTREKVASVDSKLTLNFTIQHGDSFDELLMNGASIYPVPTERSPHGHLPTAVQKVKGTATEWVPISTPILSYLASWANHHSAKDNIDLVSVRVEILELGQYSVAGRLPSAEIKLLKTPSGKLMIGDASVVPVQAPVRVEDCQTMLCRWRAMILERLSALKSATKSATVWGCGKVRPAAHITVGHSGKEHSRPGHSRPHYSHHGRPNRPHHHHRQGGITRFLRGVMMHVLIPIVVGIMVGITASLIGMVVGHVIVFAWRLLFRRGSSGEYAQLQQAETEVDEKVPEPQGPPPEYIEAIIVESEKQ